MTTELIPGEPKDFAKARDDAASPHFRVLVVDPVEMDRLVTIWLLGTAWADERNMMVECATEETEALEKIRHNRYGLIVLDWNLPQQKGEKVLRTIRETGRRVPVVVVSGERRETIASDLEALSAVFVNKDELDPDSFSNAIATAMQLQEGRSSVGLECGA